MKIKDDPVLVFAIIILALMIAMFAVGMITGKFGHELFQELIQKVRTP